MEQLTFMGPLLAEPAKGWLLTTRGMSTAAAYAAVVTEYLLYMVVSSSLSVIGLLLLLASHSLPTLVRAGAVLVIAATLAFLDAFTFASIGGIGLIAPSLLRLRAVIGTRGFSRSWVSALTIEGGIKFVGTAFVFIPGQFGASEGVYSLLVSPADMAGLRAGDVIVQFKGQAVLNANHLTVMVVNSAPNERAQIVYYRNGQQQTTTKTIETLDLESSKQPLARAMRHPRHLSLGLVCRSAISRPTSRALSACPRRRPVLSFRVWSRSQS